MPDFLVTCVCTYAYIFEHISKNKNVIIPRDEQGQGTIFVGKFYYKVGLILGQYLLLGFPVVRNVLHGTVNGIIIENLFQISYSSLALIENKELDSWSNFV